MRERERDVEEACLTVETFGQCVRACVRVNSVCVVLFCFVWSKLVHLTWWRLKLGGRLGDISSFICFNF